MDLKKNRMESNSFVEKVAEMGKIENGRLTKEENNSKPSSPNSKDPSIIDSNSRQSSSNQKDSSNQEDQLESAKAEMGEVREENERLKTVLAKIVKDYQALQMQFFDIVQQEQAIKPTETASIDQEMEEPELVSLRLGSTAGGPQKKDKTSNLSKIKDGDNLNQGLSLGLDCKFEGIESSRNQISPENSFEESKEEEVAEAWPPSKAMKMARSGEDDVSQQTHVKKTRVSVRTRCEAPTMNDGCQWRKYGQKIAKGNPCPRAYYRCTVAPACPVRKQVQRCAEDMSILITTYEGTHNHPLPISATAMASTTSAAAYMLASGSSTSQPSLYPADHRHGLNFSLSDPSGLSKPFYLQNQSISSSPYPTITLDLTSPSSSSSQFSRFAPNSHDPRHSSSSSSTFNFASDPNTSQNSWSNSYGSQNYNKNPIGSSRFLPNSTDQQLYQSYLQRPNFSPQQSMTETVAAATKAITSDPSFRSALVAAITSIVGGGSGGSVENVDQNLKWSETFSTISSYSSSANGNIGCGSSYLNRASASSSNSQSGNLMFLPPALPFSSAKNASASPVDNRENIS